MKGTRSNRELVETFLRAAVIGLCGGVVALVFRGGTSVVQQWITRSGNIVDAARNLAWWEVLLIPAAGAAAAALVVRYLVRGEPGGGMSDVMEAVSVKRGPIRLRAALSRALASLGVIATGGSVGREGPIIAISSAVSSGLTRLLRAPVRDRPMLLGCGVAAGFAAAYNAPIAGAIFALEVILGNFALELFAPVVVASTAATLFSRYVGKDDPVFELQKSFDFEMVHIAEVVPYLLLGVIAGAVAAAFQWSLRRGTRLFRSIPLPHTARMIAGGLAIGAIALLVPEVWGNGYEAVNEILDSSGAGGTVAVSPWAAAGALFGLMVAKVAGTSVTVGSGGAGGVFTPTLLVGAALGGAFGHVVNAVIPVQTGDFRGYALVGMGCLVAGTTRAPIMAVMVIFEMTLHYEIVVPLMLGCITASVVARALYENSIYTEELAERGVKTPTGIEETVLFTTRVEDVMRTTPTWVAPATTYAEILPLAGVSRASSIYVCGPGMRLLGVIRFHDVIDLVQMGDVGPTIVAADLMVPATTVAPESPLAAVFEAYETTDLEELPVVREDGTSRLLGVVTRRDVLAALHIEVLKRQNLRAKFVRREEEGLHTDYVELPKGVELARVPVHPAHIDRTMGDSAIRVNHRVTVMCVVRRDPDGREMRILPSGDFVLRKGDELIVMGADEALSDWRVQTGDR